MPAIPSLASVLETTLVHRDILASSPNSTAPTTQKALEVICAWPVSGQYGPGTRALYYVLIAACVVARKVEWIRNACLAAVLLFPAIAALHAIALAVLHVEGAVDMDIYGAFQLCAIGILTAPATVRLSQTYFNNPGRDLIFIWTVLLLAGLLSLIVEFMRLQGISVPGTEAASIAWSTGKGFPYGDLCGLRCTPEDGPTSSLREGSTDNIYVIPTPTKLSFNTTTLLAAACCIPAILSLVSMWIKILDHNYKKFTDGKNKKEPDEVIEGTNGATISHMTGIGERIRDWMSLIEVPVMAAAVLAILIRGEMNFWSDEVYYQTEPITSIGQWAPIVGTGLAVLGSLYLLLAADMDAEVKGDGHTVVKCSGREDCPTSESSASSRRESGTSAERQDSQIELENIHRRGTNQTIDTGGRRRIAQILNVASATLAARAHSEIEKTGFKRDQRSEFPEIPGEEIKNSKLNETREKYRGSSRAPSFVSSRGSLDNGEGSSRSARSPTRRHESYPIASPSPARSRRGRDHAGSLPSNDRLNSPFFCPSTPEGLSPFGARTPSRSRADSGSDVPISPTTASPPVQPNPTIVISSALSD